MQQYVNNAEIAFTLISADSIDHPCLYQLVEPNTITIQFISYYLRQTLTSATAQFNVTEEHHQLFDLKGKAEEEQTIQTKNK